MLGPKQRYFQTLKDKISSDQLRNLEVSKKSGTSFAHFPSPVETGPYVVFRGKKPGSLPKQDGAGQLLSKRRKRRAANRNPHLEDQPVIFEYLALPIVF